MSQIIQHYQTSFVVQNEAQTGENKLYQAQRLIGEWVKSHEVRRFREFGRDKSASFLIDGNFQRRAYYSSKFSWCTTDYCIEDDSLAWAVRYTHRDGSVRDVFWVSDIGLRAFTGTGRLVVSVKISYKISTEFAITGQKFEPDVSIPWCVEGLLETFDGSQFYSGEQDVTSGIKEAVVVKNADHAQQVLAYIDSHDRKLAVVLLNGETAEVKREAACLSKNLFGKALVFIVPYTFEIKKVFGRYRLEFNEAIFLPTFYVRDPSVGRALRYFVTNEGEAKARHQVLFHSWLGVHPINERGSVSDVENVQLLLRRHKFFKLEDVLKRCVPAEAYEQVKTELKDMSGLFELSESEKKTLEEKAVKLEDRVGELESRNLDLEIEKEDLKDAHATEVYNLKAQQESVRLQRDTAESVIPRQYPGSFDAFRSFEKCYRHLCFAPCAWERAAEYRQFVNFEILWEILHDLDNVLWKMVFEEDVVNLDSEYKHRTGYDYAASEGPATKNDPKLARLRQFEFEGRQYEMWSHIKHGNRKGDQLRVHFAIDRDNRRIVIGWIGDHMDNATTRSIH